MWAVRTKGEIGDLIDQQLHLSILLLKRQATAMSLEEIGEICPQLCELYFNQLLYLLVEAN